MAALRMVLPLRPLHHPPTFVPEKVAETPTSPVDTASENEEEDESPTTATKDNKDKCLPGLDFGIEFGAPILGQKYSGLVGNVLLPYGLKRHSQSHRGLMYVADIKQVLDVAVRIFEENHEIHTMRDVCEHTFAELRDIDRSWNFLSAWQKTRAIIERIVAARERHLDNHNGITEALEEFFPFLKSIDNFRKKDAQAKKSSSLKRSRLDFDSDEMVTSIKKTRREKENDELSAKPLEEQIKILKSKSEELENKLYENECNYRRERDAGIQRGLQWGHYVGQIWDVARPSINRDLKIQGKEEWERDELHDFLRANDLHDVTKALLGLKPSIQ
ncbi:hypothetical protein CORC01_08351 [Colletotrichum orchidophilum]|uniref:Uncharacterized protein n=1 Tax=Colletotrichum orchidophilum TaxID=1209926 RepID=A0A1G4B4D0_9PEZI|nr:uncharacterized protein CORC01_08351 [Colletotrichum orchidophilum]OHE96279.1 hypothetical protein CORC01_08351 [Colletotrichum orchidophilum]